MALAVSKAAPLRPDIKLSQALTEYEAVLSSDQKLSFHATNLPPSPTAVMTLTCEVDRLNAGRKIRRLGARLTSFLNSVKGFTAIVDLIIGSTGNPIAGAVWGAVKLTIQATSGFANYFESLSTLLMNVGLNSPRYDMYALLYPTCTRLQKELCNYYSVVINLCTRAVMFVRRPLIKQIGSALRKPFDDEFNTFQKDLIGLGTSVVEEVSLAAKQQQNNDSIEVARERKESSIFRASGNVFRRETATQLGQAKVWKEGRAKSRLLGSCSRYNFETTLNQARKKGASTWLFKSKEYQDWISQSSSSTLLCSGIVGAGKTVLCANVVEELIINASVDASIGYFFCKDEEAVTLKAREVLGSLARQFFHDMPTEIFGDLGPEVGEITLNTDQILSHMLGLLPCNRHYVAVLDGLEECDQDEITSLVGPLLSLLTSPKHMFKLLWTGRPGFEAKVSHQIRPDFHVHMSPSNNGPEISQFIEVALEEALENETLKLRDPQLILKIQDALEAEAQEMFLWVAFQIESLCAQNTDEDILNSLVDLPKGLPATFRRILRRLNRLDSKNSILGKKIFEIVAAAQRPLTLDEIREAISVIPGDTSWVESRMVNDIMKSLASCGGFLVVDEELSTVHFAHSSVKQHLLSQPTELDIKGFHIDLSQADANLGKIVVTYLNLDTLSTQLTTTSGAQDQYKASQSRATSIPSFILGETLPKYDMGNKIALRLLRGRRLLSHGSCPDSVQGPNLGNKKPVQLQQAFALLTYSQENWLFHSRNSSRPDMVHHLWIRLIDGTVNTVELPWAPEHRVELGERFMDWAKHSFNSSLIDETLGELATKAIGGRDARSREKYRLAFEKLEQLLEHGPYKGNGINFYYALSDNIKNALLIAASWGLGTVVMHLLRRGANVNAIINANGVGTIGISGSPLIAAIQHHRSLMVKLLLAKGANVNHNDYYYGSALHAVAEVAEKSPESNTIVRLLLDNGAYVDTDYQFHGTALKAAVKWKNEAVAQVLLDRGASINALGRPKSSASAWAKELKTSKAIGQMLYSAFLERQR